MSCLNLSSRENVYLVCQYEHFNSIFVNIQPIPFSNLIPHSSCTIETEYYTDCRKSFARIAKAAGFPKGFRPLHGLRHVYASMIASSGKVDMYTLQKLLTHKSPIMTQRYAHLRDDALKRASEIAGNIIQEASQKKADQKVVNLEDHKE